MEDINEDIIWLWEPARRRRTPISRQRYLVISDAMLNTIKDQRVITLNNLINELNTKLADIVKANLPWYILKIKSDLEERKLIVVETNVGPQRDQIIQLNTRRRKGTVINPTY